MRLRIAFNLNRVFFVTNFFVFTNFAIMKSMTDFVTPAEGEITLCEVDGRVHSMSCDYYDVNTFTSTVSFIF